MEQKRWQQVKTILLKEKRDKIEDYCGEGFGKQK